MANERRRDMKRVVVARVMILMATGATGVIVASCQSPPNETVLRNLEDEYTLAKLRNDTDAIGRIMADEYYDMNQNGNGRNKAQSLELWKTFKLTSLKSTVHRIKISGDTAMVFGRLVTGCTGESCSPEIALFMHLYVLRDGQWRMLGGMQFRDPTNGRPSPSTRYPVDTF
jgi:hypothetical protein